MSGDPNRRPLGILVSRADNLRYLLQYRELRVRSSARYIADRGGNQLLGRRLAADSERRLGDTTIPAHWQPDDVVAIANAIDPMLNRRGWRR